MVNVVKAEKMHVQERLEYVFSVAENEFKVYHLLEPSGKHSFSLKCT